jgi:hypothetical protein
MSVKLCILAAKPDQMNNARLDLKEGGGLRQNSINFLVKHSFLTGKTKVSLIKSKEIGINKLP